MVFSIITPVKNEEDNIDKMIKSVLKQIRQPLELLFIDDSSTDKTVDIIRSYKKEMPYMRLIEHKHKENRRPGKHIVSLFREGFCSLDKNGWDVIIKLDGDIQLLTENYFERIMQCFENDPWAGLCGGQIKGKYPPYHVSGANKAYSKKALLQVGLPLMIDCWDDYDEMQMLKAGWKVVVVPNLYFNHPRKVAGAYENQSKAWIKRGISAYREGLPFLDAVTKKKYLFLLGYLVGFLFYKKDRIIPKDLIKFYKRFKYKYYVNKLRKR